MTEFNMAVLSRLGETHKITVNADTCREAIKDVFWGISGCHWFQTEYSEKPCVRVTWKDTTKKGVLKNYTRFFTCDRLRLFGEIRQPDIDDLNRMLIGMDVAFALFNGRTDELEGLYDHPYHTSGINDEYEPMWVHQYDEDRTMKEFLDQFKEGVQ